MSILIDTNVLLRSVQSSHSMHEAAVRSIASLIDEGEQLAFMPQIVAEFWTAATRPVEHNGLGLSLGEARGEIAQADVRSIRRYSERTWGTGRTARYMTALRHAPHR